MIKTLKKVFRYIKKYKKTLVISIIAMIIVQVLSFLHPLIVKEILDNKLIAVEDNWYEVNESEAEISFNNKYYSRTILSNKGITILINNNKYYYVEELIDINLIKGTKDISKYGTNYLVVLKDGDKSVELMGYLLEKDEIKIFYSPFIKPLKILVALLALRFFLQLLFTYIQRISTARININIVRDARIDAVKSLQRMPIEYFEEEPAGKIANRVIHDVGGMMGLFQTIMNLVLSSTMAVVFAYVGMFYLNYKLALLTFIAFPLIYVWLKTFIKNLNFIAKKVNEEGSLITAQLNEIINGIAILQIFNYEEETTSDFNKLSRSYMNEQLKENKLHLSLGWNLIRLIGALVTAIIVLYFGNGYLFVGSFVVTAGLIYAYNTYLTSIIEPLGVLFREIGNLQHSIVRTERIFKLIDSEKESDLNYEIDKFKGSVKFEDVWFSYTKGHPILKGISFEIKEKEMIGVVGHTGSGKSTLMNLLLRFYDLKDYDSGNIYVDGININKHPKRSYRRDIGIILQDPIIFSGTLYDNVRFGSNISEDEAVKILHSLGGKSLLNKLEKGINEEISRDGQNLSVGEKQIVSFARVIAHDPKILIMDEATANIDTETEEIIQRALNKVKHNRTVIIIAHRLSTIKNADKILVLDSGQKVEEGTHEELINKNGVYANIYRSQIKGS